MWTTLEGCFCKVFSASFKGGSRTHANSKMKFFMTVENCLQPLTFVTKSNKKKKMFLGIFVTYFKLMKQPEQLRHQDDVIDVVLMSLLLNLNISTLCFRLFIADFKQIIVCQCLKTYIFSFLYIIQKKICALSLILNSYNNRLAECVNFLTMCSSINCDKK